MARPLTVEPVDATFGAVVTGFRIAELDDDTWQRTLCDLAQVRAADLSRPVSHPRPADRLRQALRAARVRDVGDQQRQGRRHAAAREGQRRPPQDPERQHGLALPIRPTCRSRPRARCSPPRKCRRSAATPAWPTCAPPTTRSTTATKAKVDGPRRLPFAALQPVQARPRHEEGATASIAATACTTGRCRSGRWSRRIPRPAASRC